MKISNQHRRLTKIKNIFDLNMPLETNYLIREIEKSFEGWRAVIKVRPNKYSNKSEERN